MCWFIMISSIEGLEGVVYDHHFMLVECFVIPTIFGDILSF